MRPRVVASALLLLSILQITGGASARSTDRGSIVLLDAATGREIAHVLANGAVIAAVSDGHGGWFVGGSFTRLSRQRRVALAHLLPSGALDPTWHAAVGGSGRPVAVNALARAGSRLYVAGPFGRIGGLQRPGLGAVDARTGAVLRSWAPTPLLWLDVQALLVAGSRLLVARNSTYPTPGIAALDTRTGALDRRWNANFRLIGDAGSFNTLLLRGSRVYVAGSFHFEGLERNGLVALNARNGEVDRRWAPRVMNCPVCNGFALLYGLATSGPRVYVSGYFSRIDGVPRNGLAALDPRTGTVDPAWKPQREGRNVIHMTLAGPRLYLGGLSGLSALDARTGAGLRLPRNHAPSEVLSLAVSEARLLAVGRVVS